MSRRGGDASESDSSSPHGPGQGPGKGLGRPRYDIGFTGFGTHWLPGPAGELELARALAVADAYDIRNRAFGGEGTTQWAWTQTRHNSRDGTIAGTIAGKGARSQGKGKDQDEGKGGKDEGKDEGKGCKGGKGKAKGGTGKAEGKGPSRSNPY